MKTIKFLGASGMVTGSSYLLMSETGDKILVDMGMFQGTEDESAHNFLPLAYDAKELTGVILTHAHVDHCGRLPALMRNGYNAPVYMTAATRAIVEIALYDSAKVQASNKMPQVMYDESDVTKFLALIRTVAYDRTFEIGRFFCVMRNAGHILGSASIEMIDRQPQDDVKKIVFSGDLGNSPQDLIQPTHYIDSADVVIMESTYGDRAHPADNAAEIIAEEIRAAEAEGGTLLMPAFSIERTQTLLHLIGHLKREGKIDASIPVYMDSPMAIKVTKIFYAFSDLYSDELKAHAPQEDPFDFINLVVTENGKQSSKIAQDKGAKVIIAGSGMMMGGRIMDHAARNLPLPTTRLLFVGYQAEETIGRQILEGAKQVWIYGKQIQVNAHIREVKGLSAHADQPGLLKWLTNIKGVRHVCLVHGEDGPRDVLKQKIQEHDAAIEVHMPHMMDEIQLS
jgi:metallo-beta-lactamase family protein